MACANQASTGLVTRRLVRAARRGNKNPPGQRVLGGSQKIFLGNSKCSLAVFYVEQVALNRHVLCALAKRPARRNPAHYLCLIRKKMSRANRKSEQGYNTNRICRVQSGQGWDCKTTRPSVQVFSGAHCGREKPGARRDVILRAGEIRACDIGVHFHGSASTGNF
jgi:hypothetical protein